MKHEHWTKGVRVHMDTIHGYVREAGGGVVVIVVDRDTDYYPPEHACVALTHVSRTAPVDHDDDS